MARIPIPEGEEMERRRMWALSPAMGMGVRAMGKAVYEDSSLDLRVREVARMRIANINACDI
jgi:hypothetical protein